MRWRVRTTTMLASLCATSVVGAQTPPKPADPDVVVTARDKAERKREAREFVRGITATPIDGQLARWHTPLCPAVLGVAPDIATFVQDRVRAVALAAGAPVAKAGCRANAFVIFTPDAHGLLAIMERRRPALLQHLSPSEARALRASRAPVISWNGTLTESADGTPLRSDPSVAFGPIASLGPAIPMTDRTRVSDSYTSSLIMSAIRVGMESAVVLVDVPRSTGRRLAAVADYAAFTILARVRPDEPEGTAPTILKLFAANDAERPTALTDMDRAYLSALYATAPNRTGTVQRASIIKAVQDR